MKKVITIVLLAALAFVIAQSYMDTGTAPTPQLVVTNFEDCVAAGNPVMESYPRQCRHDGELFVEVVEKPIVDDGAVVGSGVTMCDPSSRPEACTMQYEPVCGLVQVECITTPCNPVPETFGNGCSACGNDRVISYTEGECGLENNDT